MDKQETVKIVSLLRISFPASYANLSDQETKDILRLWHSSFQGYDFESVEAAVREFVETSTDKYAPTVGMVKSKLTGVSTNAQYSPKLPLTSSHVGKEELEMLHNLELKWSVIESEELRRGVPFEEWKDMPQRLAE